MVLRHLITTTTPAPVCKFIFARSSTHAHSVLSAQLAQSTTTTSTWSMAKKPETIVQPDLQLQRQQLPIYPAKDALIKEIKSNVNCVVVGETDTEKNTQIPPSYILLKMS